MKKEIISKKYIQVLDNVVDWEDAIRICSKSLINDEKITLKYVKYYFWCKKFGPYFDIGKNIAMPHSRPENGVNENAFLF